MMLRSIRYVGVMVVVTLWVGAANMAMAQEAAIYDWTDDEAPVMVTNSEGVILMGTDKAPMRAFSWQANDGERDKPLRIVDLRGDGNFNIVGSGTPTFALDSSGEPLFSFENGCRQVVVADIVARTNLDVVCVNRDQLRVYTDRGRFAWSVSPGRNIDWCVAGDLTGDTRNDLECAYTGSGQFLRVSYAGEVLSASGENHNLENAEESLDELQPSTKKIWDGDERFDLSGDGKADIAFEFEEGTLTVRREGDEEPLLEQALRGQPLGSLLKNMDGEGGDEALILSEQRIYVISDGGASMSDYSAHAGQYRRVPHAELASVYVNGFGEAGEEARQAVSQAQDAMSQCYGNRLRSAPYAGAGRQIMQVIVNEEGAIEQVQKRHSGVGDSAVEECALEAVKELTFPGAEEGQATVNINVRFTFRDEEE